MADRLRTRARLLTLAGAALLFLATTAAAFGGSVHSRRPAQGDPRLEQLQAGWEVYRIWCSACHAYSGEGLTPAWISTWAPDDQNCWQSKCHAVNHPDDGFYLPHFIPAIVGPGVLDHFRDGPSLYDYISSLMPYQEPGVLTSEEYFAVLAHVLNGNGIDYGAGPLSPETLGAVLLGDGAAVTVPILPTVESPPAPHITMPGATGPQSGEPRPALWLIGLLASLGLAAIAAIAVVFEAGPGRV